MDVGLVVSFTGVIIAALAGVLGVWMERDRGSPKLWGWVFSALIAVSSVVELGNTASSTQEAAATDAKLATVLEAMGELAAKGNNPALEQFVGSELAVQARANPQVVKKMEKSIAAKGGDPSTVSRRASEGRRQAAGLPARKPAAGQRPTLGGARSGSPGKAGKAGGPAGAGARMGDGGGPAAGGGAMGGAVGKAGKAGKAAGAAAEQAGAAAEQATEAAAGATTRARASADEAAKATEDAAKAADQAAEDAAKSAKDAQKAADDAKKNAADAARGLGS